MKYITFPIRLTQEEHELLKQGAWMVQSTLKDFIKEAIVDKVQSEKRLLISQLKLQLC